MALFAPNGGHCDDNARDRALGHTWEKAFCVIASQRSGKIFTAHQIGRTKAAKALCYANGSYHNLLLPDITLWSSPGEHHEIKHKRPTDNGMYGLEDYRLKALKWFSDETCQSVYYTIHRWDRLGDKFATVNCPGDWETINVNDLWDAIADGWARDAAYHSYFGGKPKLVRGWFWPSFLWRPLLSIWQPE